MPPTPLSLPDLVGMVADNHPDASALLHRTFSRGIELILTHQLDSRNLSDRSEQILTGVVQAIRRGELADSRQLPGLVRRILQDRIARWRSDINAGQPPEPASEMLSAPAAVDPADTAKSVLTRLSRRHREMLLRLYLQRQTGEEICREMKTSLSELATVRCAAQARFRALLSKVPAPSTRMV